MQTQVYVGASARTGGSISGMFRRGASDGAWVHAIEGFSDDTHVHPDDPAVVFAATSTGLYRSRDRGGRWSRLVGSAAGEQIWSVLAHPADHRVVLTACAPLAVYRGDDGGDISAYASAVAGAADGGASWQEFGIGQHAAHLRYGRDIGASPRDASDFFACVADWSRGVAGRLYRSQDGGGSWAQVDHSVDVQSTMMAVGLTASDRGGRRIA